MKLAIISHTKHYKRADGTLVGWGPTISEINHLASHFEKIYHIAAFHTESPPPSSLPYLHKNIQFVALPPTGGVHIIHKLRIVWNMPYTLVTVRKILKKVDAFQLRTPTGIGVYLIPYLTHFSKKKGWYKYAGNWNQENPPFGYSMQRKMLKNQWRKVTINGRWDTQPANCYTFENPCLTLAERDEGIQVIKQKIYAPPFTFCFVGRLDDAKGVQRIIDAFSEIDRSFIKMIHFIGNGDRLEAYKAQCAEKKLPVSFHGFLPREKVFDIYRESNFLVLPSTASEGFPKVIAEGMNFGCIPIVSNVSSIGQYINAGNGYIISPITAAGLKQIINEIRKEPKSNLEHKATQGYAVASKFTFVHYNNRILKDILQLK